jgi:hypothetical protein
MRYLCFAVSAWEEFGRGRMEKCGVRGERKLRGKEVVINPVCGDHMFGGGTISGAARTEQMFEREYKPMFYTGWEETCLP